MEKQISRYVTIIYCLVGLVLAYVLGHLLRSAFALLSLRDIHVLVKDLHVTHILGFGLSAAICVVCFKIETIRKFLSEVVTELSIVSWPTREETFNSAWIVIGAVVISALAIGLFDQAWLSVSRYFLKLVQGGH